MKEATLIIVDTIIRLQSAISLIVFSVCLFVQILQGDKTLNDVTHIIVDEVHERSLLVSID